LKDRWSHHGSDHDVRIMTIPASLALLILFLAASAQGAVSAACALSPEIRAELAKVTNAVAEPSDFEEHVAPLVALRQRHPQDLLVHELYQDAVQRYALKDT
jgi:hypothetical protein